MPCLPSSASRVTQLYTRREGTTGGTIVGRGGANLYTYGSQGTARGSRVQNREMESENLTKEFTYEVNLNLDETEYPCYHIFTSRVNPKER